MDIVRAFEQKLFYGFNEVIRLFHLCAPPISSLGETLLAVLD